MLYTTNFANLKNLPDNILPVAICGKSPDWYTGLEYKRLAPKYEFFMKWKETHDNDYYIKCYYEQVLSKLVPYSVISDILYMYDNTMRTEPEHIALICYEKSDEFCHRHLVRDWFNSNSDIYGIKCEEWRRGI